MTNLATSHPIFAQALEELISQGPVVTLMLLVLAGSIALNIYLFRKVLKG